MKKLNFLKTLVDIFWINFSFASVIFIILLLVLVFTNSDLSDIGFLFNIDGLTINKIGIYEKILILILTFTSVVLLFTFYQFKKLIKNFTKTLVFTDENINILNKIGIGLLFCAFFYSVPVYIYKIYNTQININIGFSSFILYLVSGLFFMVLSEIFKISKVQKQENDLTV
jgi:hypothetical protein